MKAKYLYFTSLGVLSLVICFSSASPLAAMEKDLRPQAIYSWSVGAGQVEPVTPPDPPGWPGTRPRYQYPPYHHYHPYHPYPPYHFPRYERERPWYEGELPMSAGRLLFLVQPVQAEAFINGYPLSRHADLSYGISLLKGEHHLEVRAEGYEPYRRTIEIRGGEQIRLTIHLERTEGP